MVRGILFPAVTPVRLLRLRRPFLPVGVDAFTTMKVAGPNSVTISQRYVHHPPGSDARASENLEVSNQPSQRERTGP